jgi:predicted ATPase/Tfp pilus assembly protein PilF
VFEIGDDSAPFEPPPDSEKAYRVVQRDGEWIGLSDVPRRLPAERDAFFGRSGDLKALARLFDSGRGGEGDTRLVTLHGAGGIGKSRLALRYGWSWLGEFPGGVWFCDLAPARGLDGLLHAVAQALDVPLGSDPAAQLGHAIAGHGRCLLILDSVEHLVRHAGATLGGWLDAAPEMRCIVTSRELLGQRGERALALDPLPPADAVALFHSRAQAAHSPYDPQRVDAGQVRQLVALLDGLPLALELAAARVGVLPPHELLARMGDRFKLLASRGGRPDRQATLQATLAWSWDTLTAAERSALAQLSVFEGGFTMPAATAVAELSACDDAPWIFDLLQSLLDKSLLRPQAEGRFAMLRSVQQYAAQQLRGEACFPGSGPALLQAAQRRHRRHFATLDETAAMADRCVELENLAAACQRAAADGDTGDAVTCLHLAWAALRLVGPMRRAVELAAAVASLPGLTPAQTARVQTVRAGALFATGDYDAARAAALQAQAAAGDTIEPALSARLHCILGEVEGANGNTDEAGPLLEEARRLADLGGDAGIRCHALNALGALAGDRGRLDEARAFYEAALTVATEARDLRWQGGLLGNLGGVHYAEGRLNEAMDAYERALKLAHRSADLRFEGNTRCNLGLIHHDQGRLPEAEAELTQALEMARTMGQRPLENMVLCNLGIVLTSQGRFEAAYDHFADAVAGSAAAGDLRSEGQYRSYLGLALARCGRFDEARACLRRGRELLLQANDPMNLGLLLCSLAECEQMAQDWADANQALGEARTLLDQHGWPAESELARRLQQMEKPRDT